MRFIFSIAIVYYHILHYNIMPFVAKTPVYTDLSHVSVASAWAVEFFFILGGLFLYRTYRAKPSLTIAEFTYDKLIRLWPVLFFMFILDYFTFRAHNIFQTLINLLFLQNSGLSLNQSGSAWYISPFFLISVFYFALLKKFDNRKLNLVIIVLVYLAYTLNINFTAGKFSRIEVGYVINLGMVRGIGGIGLGYLLGLAYDRLSAMKLKRDLIPNATVRKWVVFAILSVLEVLCLYLLLKNALAGDIYNNQIVIIILFCILLMCFLVNKGIVSLLFNHRIFSILGSYSYSIYIMQDVGLRLLKKTMWLDTDYLVHHAYRVIALSILIITAIGIATYYLVEKPCLKLGQYIKRTYLFPKPGEEKAR